MHVIRRVVANTERERDISFTSVESRQESSINLLQVLHEFRRIFIPRPLHGPYINTVFREARRFFPPLKFYGTRINLGEEWKREFLEMTVVTIKIHNVDI